MNNNNESKSTYTIQYWIDEEARDFGLSYFEQEEFTCLERSIYVAEKIQQYECLACVEVISSDENKGDYGVVHHIEQSIVVAA